MFGVVKDKKTVAQFPSKQECAAHILVSGWVQNVERHGLVFIRGVEILPMGESANAPRRDNAS